MLLLRRPAYLRETQTGTPNIVALPVRVEHHLVASLSNIGRRDPLHPASLIVSLIITMVMDDIS